jgi:hypothetical protein
MASCVMCPLSIIAGYFVEDVNGKD